MRFLVDEDLGKRFSNALNSDGYKALFVGDIMRSAPDNKILDFAKKENLIIVTEDKDFGELIFRQKRQTKGVVLFRTLTADPEKMIGLAKESLGKSEGKFTVIEEGKVRVRKLNPS